MRNKLAGTRRGTSKSAVYYQNNPSARAKKDAYNKEYHSSPERRRYRAQLNSINRKKGTYGNNDGIDEDHVSKSKTRRRSQSANRADKSKKIF